ncbi:MAG: DnaJ C-terminal domain-containing protein, partial [Clostridia bacterium]
SGYIRRTQNTLFGQQTVQSVCSHCGGKGKIVEEKCKTCRGTGFVRKEATVKVPIPAGADTGVRMTIRNEGNCGANGGGKGNLVVVIYVAESDTFRRVGADLYMDLPIGYYEAACGCDINIDTMKGSTTVKVPESTQPGTKIRIKGYGMKVLQKEVYGDLYITIKVETPRGLSSKQLKLLREFEESLSETQYPQKRRFGKK